MSNIQAQVLPGLQNPVFQSQGIFRQLLSAISEPGLISRVDAVDEYPASLHAASYAIALTLFDQDTSIHLSPSLQQADVSDSLRFHTSLELASAQDDADFVLCNELERPDLDLLNVGSEAYPDQSCTLIIQCESFFKGIIYRATGPGIETSRKICCSAFNGTLLHQRDKLAQKFPLGIDLILICGKDFFCIPRTTKLVLENN